MEVQIISEETVRPPSSTPQYLRIHKLSLLDQIAPPHYVPVILFYSPAATNSVKPCKISHHLKKSFSQILTHYYPLAGRIKDGIFSIDCNDNGASYSEANVAGDMSIIIQEENFHQLEKLLPCDPFEISPEISSQVFLRAQVNYFQCGGFAISVCMWHVIGNGPTAASSITSWAAVASGGCSGIGNVVAALRKEVGNGPYLDHPTRTEAVAALIWQAVMAATRKEYAAAIAVDLRKRMDLPLPRNCIGNVSQATFAVTCLSKDYKSLAGKLHESTEMMNEEYVRKTVAGGAYLEHVREIADEHTNNLEWLKLLCVRSWYTKDGQGIEAWIGLPKKVMPKFEKDPGISAYASFTPINCYTRKSLF
ncbi:salutaridinol 7-O-acetyltransferase, putative [Ricinus communis]|uniref:Salutaridinol 7-O-acetyltransferase, putative n=1 Tax=Ricinus communis TaxID=3988 RepID=B9RAL7_RICCO|nr:salutaridinol 7-O-acetyltransferase, putative [Ricinus communis]